MSEAHTLNCSSCGGLLADGTARCPFCTAVVEARRCTSCFHPNLASAVHCAACGRELGLDPMPESDALMCPICNVHFIALPAGETGSVHECSKCTGQFVEHGTLRTLFEERLQIGLGSTVGRAIQHAPPAGPTRVGYVPCPLCRSLMNRKNFGERSGVIVDVCKSHGIWFDRGELPRVLAFVEAGGLREAERRIEQRKHDERQKAAAAALSVSIEPNTSSAYSHEPSIVDLLRHLLS